MLARRTGDVGLTVWTPAQGHVRTNSCLTCFNNIRCQCHSAYPPWPDAHVADSSLFGRSLDRRFVAVIKALVARSTGLILAEQDVPGLHLREEKERADRQLQLIEL